MAWGNGEDPVVKVGSKVEAQEIWLPGLTVSQACVWTAAHGTDLSLGAWL